MWFSKGDKKNYNYSNNEKENNMKYGMWLDEWFRNYIQPSSKIKTCELLNRLNQGIDYSVTLCQTQEFMLRRFSVLKRYESFRKNI